MSELLMALVVYATTVLAAVWLLMDTQRVRQWRTARRARRTTRQVWAHCPASRPAPRPTAGHDTTAQLGVRVYSTEGVITEFRRAS
jgi:hypothetical protein